MINKLIALLQSNCYTKLYPLIVANKINPISQVQINLHSKEILNYKQF